MYIRHLDANGVEFDIETVVLPDEVWELVEEMWETEEMEDDKQENPLAIA